MIYTFNGWGEYKVFQQQLDSTFLFQARTAPIVNTSATQFVGFAFGSIGSDYVEVSKTYFPTPIYLARPPPSFKTIRFKPLVAVS